MLGSRLSRVIALQQQPATARGERLCRAAAATRHPGGETAPSIADVILPPKRISTDSSQSICAALVAISVRRVLPQVASLKHVTEMRLYGSHLRRLPPEIGRLTSLRELDIYRSYSLHWLPYEITRCADLSVSRMSTRALYGNRKTRLPFPRLSRPIEVLLTTTCSACDQLFGDRTPEPILDNAADRYRLRSAPDS